MSFDWILVGKYEVLGYRYSINKVVPKSKDPFFELGLVHPNVKTTRPPIYLDYNDNLDGIDSDGNVSAPDGPGIGGELDWDRINAHKVATEIIAE